MKILLATRNQGKIAELRRILDGFDIVGMEAFPDIEDVVETGVTFEENALLKARAVAAASGLPAVADDSGLCVDVLNGMPGVFSARWSGRHGDDEANIDLLLAQVGDVPDKLLTGYFACCAALALPSGLSRVVEGTLPGRLIRERRGSHGFGYDPIFVPDGDTLTTAELSPEAKDAISHRGRAFRALAPIVRELLVTGA